MGEDSQKNKSIHLFLLILLFLSLIYGSWQAWAQEKIPAEDHLLHILNDLGAKTESIHLTAYKKLTGTIDQEKNRLLGLGFLDDQKSAANCYQGKNAAFDYKIEFIEDQNGCYLLCGLKNKAEADLKTITGELHRLLGQDQQEIYYSLSGLLPQKYNNKQLKTIFSAAIRKEGGKIQEKAEEANYLSISAYFPDIYPQIESHNQKINLQIAANHRKNRSETAIFLGIPLILNDY